MAFASSLNRWGQDRTVAQFDPGASSIGYFGAKTRGAPSGPVSSIIDNGAPIVLWKWRLLRTEVTVGSPTPNILTLERTAPGTYRLSMWANRTDRGFYTVVDGSGTTITSIANYTVNGIGLASAGVVATNGTSFSIAHSNSWCAAVTIGNSDYYPTTDSVPPSVTLTGYAAKNTATVNLKGGAAVVRGGNGASGSSGAAGGGDVNLYGGTPYGTGTKGIVTASRLRADGFATATAAKTADYTATLDDGTIEVDASGAARTITLFAASGNAGKILVIKKTDSSANAVTVDANASETIDGSTTVSLASQYSAVTIQVNAAGTTWHKIGVI